MNAVCDESLVINNSIIKHYLINTGVICVSPSLIPPEERGCTIIQYCKVYLLHFCGYQSVELPHLGEGT